MPPNGLYPLPRHHLNAHDSPTTRPSFNSMDFYDGNPPFAPVKSEGTETAEERARRKQEKRERKEQKKLKKQSREPQAAKKPEMGGGKPLTPLTDPTPATVVQNGRFGPRGPYKKREKRPDGTPASATKRKRESDVHGSTLTASDTGIRNDGSLLDPNFLDGLKRTMGDLGAVFDQPTTRSESPTEPPKKKKGRPSGTNKSSVVKFIETKTSNASESTASVAASVDPKSKKQKIEKAGKPGSSAEKTFKMIRTPVPVPSVASALLSAPKKTPVPLPQKLSASLSSSESQPRKTKSIEPRILVTETPPSQMSRTSAITPRQPAIPFSLSRGHASSGMRSQKTKKGPTIDISSPALPVLASDKVAKAGKPAIGSQGSMNPLTSSQVNFFTLSNLMRYKQKLDDAPKSHPRSRRAESDATSTTSDSSSTSRSIRDMLLRALKPYTQPRGIKNPFPTPGTHQKKKVNQASIETHDEAPLFAFTSAYTASQCSVNFTEETEYLTEHLAHLDATSTGNPLPCLHKATGCSPKSEQILRLSQPDPDLDPSLKLLVVSKASAASTRAALAAHAIATSLLEHSIRARIPIPLGSISGVWRLYCPSYTASHIDKYGYGLRTLRLSELAPGSKEDEDVYTGRLHVPPRSMAFSLAPFAAPPHASLRVTGLRTVNEGYKLEVIFLGNGYLRLSVDLGLLLFGKAVGGDGGKETRQKGAKQDKTHDGIWDFLGVHEKPVVWNPEPDELEVEGAKLFSRYDGA